MLQHIRVFLYNHKITDKWTLLFFSTEGLKPSHSIQKIFAVFTKMVDAPLSPTTSSNKLEDFAKAETVSVQESQKEGWLELKINEVMFHISRFLQFQSKIIFGIF